MLARLREFRHFHTFLVEVQIISAFLKKQFSNAGQES